MSPPPFGARPKQIELDPDPVNFTAACPACGKDTRWRTVGRDKGRTSGFEIDCPCDEPPR